MAKKQKPANGNGRPAPVAPRQQLPRPQVNRNPTISRRPIRQPGR